MQTPQRAVSGAGGWPLPHGAGSLSTQPPPRGVAGPPRGLGCCSLSSRAGLCCCPNQKAPEGRGQTPPATHTPRTGGLGHCGSGTRAAPSPARAGGTSVGEPRRPRGCGRALATWPVAPATCCAAGTRGRGRRTACEGPGPDTKPQVHNSEPSGAPGGEETKRLRVARFIGSPNFQPKTRPKSPYNLIPPVAASQLCPLTQRPHFRANGLYHEVR